MKDSWQHRKKQAGILAAAEQPQSTAAPSHEELIPDAVTMDANPAPAATPPRTPQYTPQVAPRMPTKTAYASDRPACGGARDVAIRQFEQLRREVGAKQGP